MKRKAVLKLTPTPARAKGKAVTVQTTEGILVLNCWLNGKLKGRYCMNASTMEYESYFEETGTWRQSKLGSLLEGEAYGGWYSYYWTDQEVGLSDKDGDAILLALKKQGRSRSAIRLIGELEDAYSSDKRVRREQRRVNRIKEKMDRVPPLPADFGTWMHQTAAFGMDYAFYDKETKQWGCTACGGRFEAEAKKIRHNDWLTCPKCKKKIQAKKRTQRVALATNAIVLQDVGPEMGVERHVDVKIEWEKNQRTVKTSEAARFLLTRSPGKYECELYYNQTPKGNWGEWGEFFDEKNPANRRTPEAYLHPGREIMEALSGTAYEPWGRIFLQMAEAGIKLDYNRMLAQRKNPQFINTIEYLFKGRFERMLKEAAEKTSIYSGGYYGILNMQGTDVKEVFGLGDQQKINRIRDCNGGEGVLEWMRWSESTGKKVDQETLGWLSAEEVGKKDADFILDRSSPKQIMNYVKKQQESQYRKKSSQTILRQWEDYLSMCSRQGKDVKDEMVYRPRELKRRHDEAVEEIRKQRMMEQMEQDQEASEKIAENMREKYPGAEEILKEIADKYEYQNETYRIIVPEELVQIAQEGFALHHCAGASERYYERIMQRETYICFLRRMTEPEVPYYTIEIEPGGTIRQHRSYLDEEPGIEEIREFLKEWQREVKKRLTASDHRLARESEIKRKKNIEELKEQRNARVLKGLEEDFMEAI